MAHARCFHWVPLVRETIPFPDLGGVSEELFSSCPSRTSPEPHVPHSTGPSFGMSSAAPGFPQPVPPTGAFASTFPPPLFSPQPSITQQQNGKGFRPCLPPHPQGLCTPTGLLGRQADGSYFRFGPLGRNWKHQTCLRPMTAPYLYSRLSEGPLSLSTWDVAVPALQGGGRSWSAPA